MAIICDIDDTVLKYGDIPIRNTIEYLKSLEGPVFMVTGRSPKKRAETVRALRAAGVSYSRLYMAPDDIDDNEFKYETGKALAAKYNITIAIDNSPKARAAYAKAGIKTKDPASLPKVGKFWNLW